MTAWAVAIPVWGDEFIGKFIRTVLPAIKLALAQLPSEDSVRFIVHTDNPDALRPHFETYLVDFHPAPNEGNSHVKLGEVNRQALRLAKVGEAVALINSDMVPSLEVFSASRKRFAEGKKLIMCMGTRALEESGPPPIGATARDLLRWAWEHRHAWTTGCIWGSGNSRAPTVLYFNLPDGVILHAFHLHPFALLKEESSLSFQGVTIDRDLMDQFPYSQIHVVTSADELAFAEMSPGSKDLGTGNIIDFTYVAGFAKNVATTAHRWLFGHRIEIIGPANDLSDVPVVSRLLHEIEIYIPRPQPGAPGVVIGTMGYLSKERQDFLMAQASHQKRLAERFFIALPAWGDRHVEMATKYVIPALDAARLRTPNSPIQVIVYTDQPDVMQAALDKYTLSHDIRKANTDINPHEMLNIVHKQVITETPVGASIVLLDGDTVPSCELFSYTLALIPDKRVIATSAIRTVIGEQGPPIGVTGRELLGWGWRNRHPSTDSCVWSRSHTSFPNVLFFEQDDSVVMHTFHVHPFIMLKDRNPHFKGTIDDDLLGNYEKHEIQYVTGAELGFIEISPPDWGQGYSDIRNEPMTIESVAKFARIMIPCHWRNFREQIRIIGHNAVDTATTIESIQKLVRPSIHHPWPLEAQQ